MWTNIAYRLNGWKTIIFARSLGLVGLLVSLLTAIDPGMVLALVPPKYAPFVPLILTAIGVVVEWLRHYTVAPIGVKVTTTEVDPGPPQTVSTSDNA